MYYAYSSRNGPDKKLSAGAIQQAKAGADRSRRTQSTSPFAGASFNQNVLKDMMKEANAAYYDRGLGMVRNVIDIMSSFGSRGVRIVHPNKKKQAFYNAWAALVDMPTRTERFMNYLYRLGNTPVKRNVAKLNKKQIDAIVRAAASYRADVDLSNFIQPRNNEIPVSYTFLNPASIDVVDGELATFLGRQFYTLRIPPTLVNSIKAPKGPTQQQLVNMLPAWVREPVKSGQNYVLLDNDMVSVYHYMKDDWMQWGVPMIHGILDDLALYKKMKKADGAALDGVIGQIRIWNVGSLEHKIQPGPAAMAALQDILLAAEEQGGLRDLVWDDALRLHETSTNAHQFLGSAKYGPVWMAIYAGLGVPQSLSGGESGGFTNNAISINTLIERLAHGRDIAVQWWRQELNIVREAIGDKQEPMVVFDYMNLYDDAAKKMLWIHLYDRYLVSDETVREHFGMIPEVEDARIHREEKKREKGRMPHKTGPFVDGQPEYQLAKIALQQGTFSPTEAGAKRKPRAKGDKSLLEHNKVKEQGGGRLSMDGDPSGQPGQGRPPGSRDSVARKQRRVLPRGQAKLVAWARKAQKQISKLFDPRIRKQYGGEPNEIQTAASAGLKLAMLWAAEPYQKIDAAYITSFLESATMSSLPLPAEFRKGAQELLDGPNPPTVEEAYAYSYAVLKSSGV